MSAKERIGKLEALLARIRTNAASPRAGAVAVAVQTTALPTVPPSAEAREKMRSESTEFEAPKVEPPPPPPAAAEEPLESRARLVAAQPAEAIEEEEVEVLELDERHIVSEEPEVAEPEVAVAAPTTEKEEEEPPPSSRRPIAEPAETPQEAELQVATAAPPMTPPPESGRQVATEPLSFDDDFTTGVRESGARLQPEPAIPLQSLREPSPPPPPHELEAELPRAAPPVFSPAPPEVEVLRGEETRPPPGPMPLPKTEKPAAPVHEVTRPTTPVAASEVASMVGAAPTFSPKTFGELLEASLSL